MGVLVSVSDEPLLEHFSTLRVYPERPEKGDEGRGKDKKILRVSGKGRLKSIRRSFVSVSKVSVHDEVRHDPTTGFPQEPGPEVVGHNYMNHRLRDGRGVY